jgi:hypothetical protein
MFRLKLCTKAEQTTSIECDVWRCAKEVSHVLLEPDLRHVGQVRWCHTGWCTMKASQVQWRHTTRTTCMGRRGGAGQGSCRYVEPWVADHESKDKSKACMMVLLCSYVRIGGETGMKHLRLSSLYPRKPCKCSHVWRPILKQGCLILTRILTSCPHRSIDVKYITYMTQNT